MYYQAMNAEKLHVYYSDVARAKLDFLVKIDGLNRSSEVVALIELMHEIYPNLKRLADANHRSTHQQLKALVAEAFENHIKHAKLTK